MKKNKPKPRFKILSPHWYNPFFWIAVLIIPILNGIHETISGYKEVFSTIKDMDLS